ncbi:hypothetical protein PGTDC60_1422 [Porphyromonas gingivalis TDC60]|uniref:SoxR reducing system RseC family protein n=1 Tax=Porphyromonas gingivalis TaxID=837 RepID=UPI00020EFF42|nr:SoxR reducing system RseC family protein [Porphyromonas gingivalis]AUR48748.1 Fis transcriptional regulator [Porphyromonas gingivalis]BAK25571.1 hypothetical protein PGTDC60_1422 [Porphyromonas gingivalis TDC60]
MGEIISHSGVVSRVEADKITVCVQQKSACASCHAAGYCSSTDCKDRYITVMGPAPDIREGDRVLLEGHSAMGRLAVILSFIVPLILLLLMLVLTISILRLDEGMSTLISLGALGVYYLILRLFNGKLSRRLVFTIRKNNQ